VTAPAHRGRRDNGLASEAFSAVADVDPRLGDHLLDVLGLRDIPAYVEPAPAHTPVAADRLFVASGLTSQARGVLNDLANELGIQIARDGHSELAQAPRDLLADLDLEAEFAGIIADMPELSRPLINSVPPEPVIRTEQRQHDDVIDHFVPPPAPPLPRLTLGGAIAVLVTLSGVLVIALGGLAGLDDELRLPLGVLLILFGAGLLFLRLRGDTEDDTDDGAIV
jgi:hypothetical protein